jgi:hypothetical protein
MTIYQYLDFWIQMLTNLIILLIFINTIYDIYRLILFNVLKLD